MIIKELATRGVIFDFEDDNRVYMIKGQDNIFLCDTHLGPDSMKHVKRYIIENDLADKDLYIFNSHSDYDHIWGNCAFEDVFIIGHKTCRKRIQERGLYDLEKKGKYQRGNVEIVLPNITFNKGISFEEEEIEFIFTPGHTGDSAIAYDRKDSVLYIGDLVESPLPLILNNDIELFLNSLNYIKKKDVETIISSHSGIVDKKIINGNIKYLQQLLNNENITFDDETLRKIHAFNVKNRLIVKYEKIARDKFKDEFDYKKFKSSYWNMLGVKDSELVQEFSHIIETDYRELKGVLEKLLS